MSKAILWMRKVLHEACISSRLTIHLMLMSVRVNVAMLSVSGASIASKDSKNDQASLFGI